jgi:hypothetical protein
LLKGLDFTKASNLQTLIDDSGDWFLHDTATTMLLVLVGFTGGIMQTAIINIGQIISGDWQHPFQQLCCSMQRLGGNCHKHGIFFYPLFFFDV